MTRWITALLALFFLSGPAMATRLSRVRGSDAGFLGRGEVTFQSALRDPSITKTRSLPVYDGNGNVVGLVDGDTGQSVATYSYGPFGEVAAAYGERASACPFRFQTKLYDTETGYYYFGKRYYDPETRTWISRDPLREGGGINLYAYCGNDPVGRHDPVGLITFDEFYGMHLSPDALAYKGKVAAGVVYGGFEALAKVPESTFIITAGTLYYCTGWEQYAPYKDAYLKLGQGLVSFASHPIDTTVQGVSNWQENIARSALNGDGFGAGRPIGGAAVNGIILGETVVNPAVGWAAKARGPVGNLATTLNTPLPRISQLLARGRVPIVTSSGAANGGTEVVQRAMSRAELEYLKENGTLRFGKAATELDPTFVSDAVNADLIRARLRLALPKTPEVRVTLEVEEGIFAAPSKVKPLDLGNGRILPGGGTERTATGVIRARVLGVDEL